MASSMRLPIGAAAIIIGIIGVETFYGRVMGSFRVLDALATLSDSNGNVLASINPADALNASFSATLPGSGRRPAAATSWCCWMPTCPAPTAWPRWLR